MMLLIAFFLLFFCRDFLAAVGKLVLAIIGLAPVLYVIFIILCLI